MIKFVVELVPGWSAMIMYDDFVVFTRRDGMTNWFTYEQLGFK